MAILSIKNKLCLSLVLDNLCFTMMMVIFYPYVNKRGASQLYLGSIMSAMSLIGLIWNPMIGSLGDSYGRRAILLRMSLVSAISHFLLLVSDSLVMIFIARVIAAFGGPIIPILGTAASEFLSKEDQSSYYGRLPAIMSIGFIVGSLIGGFVSDFKNGFAMCLLMMIMFNVMNIVIARTLPEPEKKKIQKEESMSILKMADKEIKTIVVKLKGVKWAEYADIFSVKLCFELGCSLFYRSIGPTLVQYGVQTRSMGYVFTLLSICTIAANAILANLKKTVYSKDGFGAKRLFHASILYVITSAIMGFSSTLYIFISGIATMSVARTISDSTFTEALMAKATEADRGGVNGAFESIVSLCGLTTPLAAGILSDWYGNQFVLRLSILPTVFGLWLTFKQL